MIAETGEMIDFSRLGGQISYDEWKKGLNERQLERLQDDDYTAVVNKYEDDIDIEKGKTYLVFLDHTFAKEENEYAITGFAYGLREVKDADIQTRSAEVMVKNNVTGKYEALSKVVVLD